MKKLLILFSAALLVITSCSKDDENTPSNSTSLVLPKTVKLIFPSDLSDNLTSTMLYNGNKILSIKIASHRLDYTYTGNVITKITEFEIVNGKEEKIYESTFVYANNKLVSSNTSESFSSTYPEGRYKSREAYTHNSDGTVKVESFSTEDSGIENKTSETINTYRNGNLIKKVRIYTDFNGQILTYTDEYVYDFKNFPFKNVLGFNLLLFEIDDISSYSNTNNCIKITSTNSNTIGSSFDEVKINQVYDTNGYPTKITVLERNGKEIDGIIEYTY